MNPYIRGAMHGRQRLEAGQMGRHIHNAGYAALVLSGTYEEVGDAGRWLVAPGEVLVHSPYESHLNRIGRRGADILNLSLPILARLPCAFQITCPDEFVTVALRDPQAAACLLEPHRRLRALERDWPDLLAAALRANPRVEISAWAKSADLAPATVSRGFSAVYGTTPTGYRSAVRAQRAWHQIMHTNEPFAAIAYECGFSDQAHFSRALRDLTGSPPSAWRKVKSLQED